MGRIVKRFLENESAATMVEYAVLIALIATAVIATVYLIGIELDNSFERARQCFIDPVSC